jgi:hypothetical protein
MHSLSIFFSKRYEYQYIHFPFFSVSCATAKIRSIHDNPFLNPCHCSNTTASLLLLPYKLFQLWSCHIYTSPFNTNSNSKCLETTCTCKRKAHTQSIQGTLQLWTFIYQEAKLINYTTPDNMEAACLHYMTSSLKGKSVQTTQQRSRKHHEILSIFPSYLIVSMKHHTYGGSTDHIILIVGLCILLCMYQSYRNLCTQQMSVLVLLCASYTTCFGPYWWPSSGGL